MNCAGMSNVNALYLHAGRGGFWRDRLSPPLLLRCADAWVTRYRSGQPELSPGGDNEQYPI